jgi:hypothetical protein
VTPGVATLFGLLGGSVTRRVVTALLILFFNVDAGTTVVVPADVAELSRESDAIVRGRIVGLDARWTDDGRSIETIVTLDAETYLKGGWGQRTQFRVPGGQLGRYRRIVVGAPQFAPGQRVIVFLGAGSGSVPYLLGFGQGVFRVVQDGSAWVVTPPPAGAPGLTVRGARLVGRVPLDDFEQRVRALAVQVQ